MRFSKSDPLHQEGEPFVSVYCTLEAHGRLPVASFELRIRDGEPSFDMAGSFIERTRRGDNAHSLARGQRDAHADGLAQLMLGEERFDPNAVDADLSAATRTTFTIRCDACRDNVSARREALEPVLAALVLAGVSEVSLSALRCYLGRSR